MILLQLYFLALITNSLPSGCSESYFPPGLFAEEPADDRAAAVVAGTYLCRLGEFPMSTPPEPEEAYRVTWLRPFEPVVVVRVSTQACDRSATAHLGVLPLGSNRLPTELKQLDLTAEKWKELKQRIKELGFWNTLQNEPASPGVITIDASQWIIEGYRKGGYKAIQRAPPEVSKDERFIELAVELLKTGGIDVSGLESK